MKKILTAIFALTSIFLLSGCGGGSGGSDSRRFSGTDSEISALLHAGLLFIVGLSSNSLAP